jgi:thiol:disulfide interchange protein DsbD
MNLIKQVMGLLLLLALNFSSVLQAQEAELLPPEEAFSLSAWMEGDALVVEYRIAPGYYMYRERFDFQIEASDAAVRFDGVRFPRGKIKNDEFFGDMEVYRDNVRILLPLIFEDTPANSLQVKATGQGCADIGICYPPLKQSLAVDVASSARITPTEWVAGGPTPATQGQDVAALQSLLGQVTTDQESNTQPQFTRNVDDSNTLAVLQALGGEISFGEEDEILHPDQAFILSARLDASNVIQTNILLADNVYVYRDKIKIAMVDGKGHTLGAISVPRGKKKIDEFFGPVEVIYEEVDVSIPFVSSADASEQFTLSYQYQGCVEDRICYPPITRYLAIDTSEGLIQVRHEAPATVAGITPSFSPAQPETDTAPISEQDQFTRLLNDQNLMLIVGLFFLAGIGLTFTPCVFPMIPILSSIIAGQGASITTRKAFFLSLVYVLAMAVTYAAAGAIVGYYGAEFNIQIWFQDPWILSTFAAIFVLLALSMFGFYELQMPDAIQSRLTAIGNSQQGGTLVSAGLMGFFSAIIVGPCITAPLVGALIFISQTQNWQLGALALFALGLGMGVPLMLVGTSAGKLLPRAGAWMDTVKAVFGVVLLGVAIWLLERFLPVGFTMALIGALMIGSAIYMGALDTLSDAASGWQRLFKSLGLLALIYGAAYLIGAAAGSNDLIQPLRVFSVTPGGSAQFAQQRIEFRQIKGRQGLQFALNDSVQQGRTTMLDFYADWCISCKEMEKYTFTHAGVLAALGDTATLQADVTANDPIDTELMSSMGIYGPPAIFFRPQRRRNSQPSSGR